MWKAPAPTGTGAASAGGTSEGGAVRIGGAPRARLAACACNVDGVAARSTTPPEAGASCPPDAVAYLGAFTGAFTGAFRGALTAEAVVHFAGGAGAPSPAARTRAPSASSKSAGVGMRRAVVAETGPGATRTVRTRAISIAGP